jgi:hypothetical protein
MFRSVTPSDGRDPGSPIDVTPPPPTPPQRTHPTPLQRLLYTIISRDAPDIWLIQKPDTGYPVRAGYRIYGRIYGWTLGLTLGLTNIFLAKY